VEDSPDGWGKPDSPQGRFKGQAEIRRSEMIVYIILAVIFVALLFMYVRVRGKRVR
jgi:hypothetical protein